MRSKFVFTGLRKIAVTISLFHAFALFDCPGGGPSASTASTVLFTKWMEEF